MFEPRSAFNGFSVDDIGRAKAFYGGVLGLELQDAPGGTRIRLPGGRDAWMYPKPDHAPATYTMLNFVVDDIDQAADALRERGVQFERYEGMPQDDRGVLRPPAEMRDRYGPPIAWFRDPAGNILALIEVSA